MEPLEFGKFIVQLLQKFWDRCAFITECEKGQSVIKRRLGYPIKWRNKPRLYWKWPVIDMFDKVDMRKKYLQLNAHSFHSNNMEKSTIPYNLIIDFQVEYQVINPLVIYDEYGFAEGESAQLSYINNKVQSRISDIIIEKGINITYEDIYNHLDKISEDNKKETLDYIKTKSYDCKFRDRKTKKMENNILTEEYISINNIVVTSFDKNISLRTTV